MQRLRIVLGQVNLTAPVAPAVNQFTDALDFTAENVLAENIYELTVTFLVQRANGSKAFYHWSKIQARSSIILSSSKVMAYLKADSVQLRSLRTGQLVGVEIGMTVLSERGLVMTEKGGMTRARYY